ncbi:MAG: DUF4239 domain-containing protein [Candidatus Rokuibacteriota bacterium]
MFVLTLALFLGMLLFLEIGRRAGIRRLQDDSSASAEGIGAVDGAVFAVLALLIAFTFSGAAARFDSRRELIVQETNHIATAYLRIDLLPADARPALRERFRSYLDTRIEVYRKLPDIKAARESLAKGNELQRQIWQQAVEAIEEGALPAPLLLLPALNAMIDITTTRTMATHMHPPAIVFVMLFALALAASLMAGYGMTGSALRSRLHMLGFALVMAVAIFVILDLEYPRLGLVRVDAFDQALVDLRESMNRDWPRLEQQ